MNVYDSQRMADMLASEGFSETVEPQEADVLILNTCHIREKAAEKVYSELGRIRRLKSRAAREGRHVLVAVAGCVAQAEGEEIIRRAPTVDLVFGPQSYHRLPELIGRASGGSKVVDTEFPVEDKFDHLAPASREATKARGANAFVTVQEGCDKFCTFCVVPYTRGAEMSRPVAKLIAEVERLADAGVREIRLIGQNVNAYHGEGPDGRTWSLARLLHRLAEVPGVARLRYTTSHPRDMDDDLIAAHRPAARGAPRYRADLGLHRRLSRRDRKRFRRHPRSGRCGRLCRRILVQIFAAPGDARRRPRGPGRRGRESRPPGAAAAGDRPGRRRLQQNLARPHDRCAVREDRAAPWPAHRPLALSAAGPGHGADIILG
jgi:hypothetical protein